MEVHPPPDPPVEGETAKQTQNSAKNAETNSGLFREMFRQKSQKTAIVSVFRLIYPRARGSPL